MNNNDTNYINAARRRLLQYGGVALTSPSLFLSACGSTGGTGTIETGNSGNSPTPTQTEQAPLKITTQDKAIVCIMLNRKRQCWIRDSGSGKLAGQSNLCWIQ